LLPEHKDYLVETDLPNNILLR